VEFDSTLNLAWAILGLGALVATARVALREGSRQRVPRWLLVVGLIITALFPYISASDDILRLGQGLAAPAGTVSGAALSERRQQPTDRDRRQTDDLLRLYNTLDTPLECRLIAIKFDVLLVAFVLVVACRHISRIAPDVAGRSPPRAVCC
jgi:hypothetical protein